MQSNPQSFSMMLLANRQNSLQPPDMPVCTNLMAVSEQSGMRWKLNSGTPQDVVLTFAFCRNKLSSRYNVQ